MSHRDKSKVIREYFIIYNDCATKSCCKGQFTDCCGRFYGVMDRPNRAVTVTGGGVAKCFSGFGYEAALEK